ncbi:MAG TPA: glycosyltransferase family 4 protein [Nitrospiraceae bacterium]|nr:glycosyltransferase family 4 protein [Nitrospiraceae bacterium]
MKVLYFAKASEIGPSSRYRIFQYVPYLKSCAVDVAVKPLFGPTYFRLILWPPVIRLVAKAIYVGSRFVKRMIELLTLGKTDLVVIEGQLFPYMGPAAERLLSKRYRFVVELDDAIYLTYRHDGKIPAILRMSFGAIVGNRTLAGYAAGYTRNVRVIPTVVDTDRFHPMNERNWSVASDGERPLVIVWIGLDYNVSFLDLLVPAFQRLQKDHRVIVRIISSRPYSLSGIKTEFRPWSFNTEVADLQTSDIGIMPLPDTEWARGKCGLKLLQYMAVGIPCVASPVGVNREIISDGRNGFLAATDEEWYTRLTALCRDPTMRFEIGRAGRNTVESDYSLKGWAPRLAEAYRALADASRSADTGTATADSAGLPRASLTRRSR